MVATIIVEDGSIVANANSYVSEAELSTFASNRGITLTGTAAVLIIQSMDYIESLNYKGFKLTDDQSLLWPRTGVIVDGYLISSDEIPQELKDGQMQTCIAIDEGNDPLQDSPRKTKREKVGDLEVEYSDSSSSVVINKKITATLKKLLDGGAGGNTFKVSKA